MAAVRPAGPDPATSTLTCCGGLTVGSVVFAGPAGAPLGPGEQAGGREQRPHQGVGGPHPTAEGVDVEEADEGDGDGDQDDDGHRADEQAEDHRPDGDERWAY